MVKNLPASAGDNGFDLWVGRSPGVEDGDPLQYSCPILVLLPIVRGNPMDRGAWGLQFMGWQRADTAEHTGTHDLPTPPSPGVLGTSFRQEGWQVACDLPR